VAGKAGSARRLIDRDKRLLAMARELTGFSVSRTTHAAYEAKVKLLGGYGVQNFLEKLLEEYLKPCRPSDAKRYSPRFKLATATVRYLKAACIHMAEYHRAPWSDDDSRQIETLLNGYEAENVPPRRRGALTPAQFKAFVKEARRQGLHNVADAALLQWATCTRPRDVRAVCLARVLKGSKGTYSMWAERKIPIFLKKRFGADEVRQIMGQEAQKIVASRVRDFRRLKIPSHQPFFPMYTCHNVRKVLKVVAKRWPKDLLYDGAHTFRHGSATEAFAAAIADVRQRGGWKTDSSAIHYSNQGLAGRSAAAAARARQAQ
jgi:integrase